MSYNPSQPRDENGQWAAEGSGSGDVAENMFREKLLAHKPTWYGTTFKTDEGKKWGEAAHKAWDKSRDAYAAGNHALYEEEQTKALKFASIAKRHG